MKTRKKFRWKWTRDRDEEENLPEGYELNGTYDHGERTTRIHPKFRRWKRHDELWTVLGHEFMHLVVGRYGHTKRGERIAKRLELIAGLGLHDFAHNVVKSGMLPKCTGDFCPYKDKE